MAEVKFQVGDEVRVKSASYHNFKDGTRGVVASGTSLGTIPIVESYETRKSQAIFPKDLELITSNMKTRTLSSTKQAYDYQIGDICQITEQGGHGLKPATMVQIVEVGVGYNGTPLRIFKVHPLHIQPKSRPLYAQWVAGSHLSRISEKSTQIKQTFHLNTINTNNMSNLTITETQLKLNAMTLTKEERKALVAEQAVDLMARDGKITTLDLKNKLRLVYPGVLWNQYATGSIEGVSDLFHELVREGKFRSIADNGTYQTYVPVGFVKPNVAGNLQKALTKASKASTNPTISKGGSGQGRRGLVAGSATALAAGAKAAATRAANKNGVITTTVQVTGNAALSNPTPTSKLQVGNIVRVGKRDLRDRILKSKGIISVTFTKQDGTERTLAGVVVKDQKDLGLGYILMKDLVKTKKEGKEVIRQANIQTTKRAKIAGVTYQVK